MQGLNHGKNVYALTMANGHENIIISAVMIGFYFINWIRGKIQEMNGLLKYGK